VRNTIAALLALCALVLLARPAAAANDAAAGYESIRPSLVKVWAFDRNGRPSESGTGVVVDSDDRRSLVLTATHVVNGASSIRIDVSRDVHDLAARVERAGPRDLTLLRVDRANLRVARFAPRTRAVVEGNLVAVAGYVKNDELIGVVGQEPRILFPGTVASRPDNGQYLELENLHIEEGLSGGAVFDPATGEVLGIVTSRTTDRRGGFADSGALVVLPFLNANRVAIAAPKPAPARAVLAAAPPRVVPHVTLSSSKGRSDQATVDNASSTARVAAPRDARADMGLADAPRPAPAPTVTLQAQLAVASIPLPPSAIVSWQALVTPHRRGSLLAISLAQRGGQSSACDAVTDTQPTNAAYEPTAMSYDGHHVTIRFVYAGNRDNVDGFPLDASLDATLDVDAPLATVQFYDRDWSGSIVLPLARTSLAAVSSTW
jgi:S1-C subfamily serine protease